jgi:hypothetical protein
MQVLELFVAPVHLDLLGVQVDTSPIRVTITTKSGQGLVLGNAVTELINLFNPPLPAQLDINFLKGKLDQLLVKLDQQLPGIPSAEVPPVPVSEGQILNVTVPPLDLNLLGPVLEASPVTVNASAETGNGLLLGNVLTTALNTLDATPENLAELSGNVNAVLAKVVGVLNAADLTLAPGARGFAARHLANARQPYAHRAGRGRERSDSRPANRFARRDFAAGQRRAARSVDHHEQHRGPPLGPDGRGAGAGQPALQPGQPGRSGRPGWHAQPAQPAGGGRVEFVGRGSGRRDRPTLTLDPLNIDLLGLEVRTTPIIVTLSTQGGEGKLLGNLLTGITTLINTEGVGNAINNVLSTTVDLVSSAPRGLRLEVTLSPLATLSGWRQRMARPVISRGGSDRATAKRHIVCVGTDRKTIFRQGRLQ